MATDGTLIVQIYKDESISWYEVDKQGALLYSNTHVAITMLPKQQGRRCIVLLPGQDVFLDRVQVPHTTYQNIMKAVSLMLEDKLLDDIDALHMVGQRIDKTNEYLVAAILRTQLEYYLQLVTAQGLRPEVMLPDFLALPYEAKQWFIRIDKGYAIVRDSAVTGYAVAVMQLPFTLRLKAKQQVEQPIHCQISIAEDEQLIIADMAQQLGEHFVLQPVATVLPFAQQLLTEKPVINFLQGDYRVKSSKKNTASYWRYAGYAFGVWVLIIFGTQVTDWIYYAYRNAQLNKQITTAMTELFPGITNITDPGSFVQKRLQALGAARHEDVFLMLLSQVGVALSQTQNSIKLTSLTYQDQQLTLVITANTLAAIENFSHLLEQHNLIIKHNQVDTGQDSIMSRIVVEQAT